MFLLLYTRSLFEPFDCKTKPFVGLRLEFVELEFVAVAERLRLAQLVNGRRSGLGRPVTPTTPSPSILVSHQNFLSHHVTQHSGN